MGPAIPIGTLTILGPEHMPAGMGLISSVDGIGNVVAGSIIGQIRDRTGSYAVSLWNSTMSAGTATIFFLVTIVIKHRAQRRIIKSDSSEHGFTVTKL
ncbi:hypothetical protein CHS0354_000205 [Potamilus streckersoni]|uniref:Major facilitator superfamily (MFS) profile domain-containing protein n=1 Tax=Potamilus streckersoni TaxID=2493646 RepID=A0AAE0RQL0_9BIVA|nr:hypothetical protein CHS0354_000205 [Potamilus streckersoni]